MDDVDAILPDELFELPRVAAQPQRIDARIDHRDPFAAGGRQLVDQRSALGGDQRARAGEQQHMRDVHRAARGRLFVELGHNLEDRRTGEGAPRDRPLVKSVAHANDPSQP